MNHPADQGLKDNYSGEKKRRGIFQRLMARPFLVLGWIAVGIACLLLAIFVLYPHRTAPASLLSDLKTRPEVFRIKIPEEIKIEQNLFRRKIPDIDQVVKLLTKFDFVERNQLLEQNEIAYYQTIFKDKPWFQLLYGIYATKKDAQAAAENLPLKIRKSSPWIRRLSAVQKAIRRKAAQ
ncbi:MAG: SPOR domain-containing protein [Desulfobacteraceae bacterium]|nr:SPOR domain-containing protein [Desulfobacteraceae bacterium]